MARTPKQPHLPDETFEPPAIVKEIEPFADAYEEARDARIERSGPEKEAKKNLISAMRERNLKTLGLSDGRQVVLTDKLNVKVAKPGKGKPMSADDESDEEDGG